VPRLRAPCAATAGRARDRRLVDDGLLDDALDAGLLQSRHLGPRCAQLALQVVDRARLFFGLLRQVAQLA
jgi:hypothetical protein